MEKSHASAIWDGTSVMDRFTDFESRHDNFVDFPLCPLVDFEVISKLLPQNCERRIDIACVGSRNYRCDKSLCDGDGIALQHLFCDTGDTIIGNLRRIISLQLEYTSSHSSSSRIAAIRAVE